MVKHFTPKHRHVRQLAVRSIRFVVFTTQRIVHLCEHAAHRLLQLPIGLLFSKPLSIGSFEPQLQRITCDVATPLTPCYTRRLQPHSTHAPSALNVSMDRTASRTTPSRTWTRPVAILSSSSWPAFTFHALIASAFVACNAALVVATSCRN